MIKQHTLTALEEMQIQAGVIAKARTNGVLGTSQPFTNLKLIKEITDQLPLTALSSICVWYTAEWAAYLKYMGYQNITVMTLEHDQNLQKICDYAGYKYIILKHAQEKNMKFDTVVGNPPYQNGDQKDFYLQFVYRAFELAPVVAMVIPARWTPVHNATYKKLSRTLLANKLTHFSWLPNNTFNVQMTTCYFITNRNAATDDTVVTMLDKSQGTVNIASLGYYPSELTACAVLSKIAGRTQHTLATRACSGSLYENAMTAGSNKIVFRAGRAGQPVPYYLGSLASVKATVLYGKNKVIVSRNGAEKKLGPVKICDADAGIGFACFGLETASPAESANLVDYLESNLVRFLVNQFKRGTKGNSKELFSKLPQVDLSRSWNNTHVYKHFGLTSAEIVYIENAIK